MITLLEELGFLIVERVNGGVIHQPRSLAMNTKPTAFDAYLQRLPMIFDKIEALRQLADDHFGHAPDAIHWGHVRDLGRADSEVGNDKRQAGEGKGAFNFQHPAVELLLHPFRRLAAQRTPALCPKCVFNSSNTACTSQRW
jgi:hypothetical protein